MVIVSINFFLQTLEIWQQELQSFEYMLVAVKEIS